MTAKGNVSSRTREDVVRAAGRLFAKRGFHGTSMRELGKELGLFGSSLYSHIEGKDQLLVEVIRTGGALFQRLADEVAGSGEPPDRRLAALVAGHVRIVTDHIDEATTFLNEARFLPDEARVEILEMRDRYEAAYRDVLRAGVDAGMFRSDLDVALHAMLVLSLLNALERWYRPAGQRSAEEIADAIYQLIMEGIHRREDL